MKDLPNELWCKVFSLACTDTGKTGRSLCAVSHRISNLSEEYRYQSIAATSAEQVSKLHERLIALPSRLQRVRFLYLNCTPARETKNNPLGWGFKVGRSSQDAALDPEVEQILLIVAPTLETLSFVAKRIVVLSKIELLPRLQELSVRGYMQFIFKDPSFAPNLERLDVPYGHMTPDFRYRVLATAFPCLTHLCVHDVEWSPRWAILVEELKIVLGIHPEATMDESRNIVCMPPAHRILSLQRRHATFSDLRLFSSGGQKGIDAALQSWLDRLDGKEGCWQQP